MGLHVRSRLWDGHTCFSIHILLLFLSHYFSQLCLLEDVHVYSEYLEGLIYFTNIS